MMSTLSLSCMFFVCVIYALLEHFTLQHISTCFMPLNVKLRLHDRTRCPTDCATGWMLVGLYTMHPVVEPVAQQVVSCKRGDI